MEILIIEWKSGNNHQPDIHIEDITYMFVCIITTLVYFISKIAA